MIENNRIIAVRDELSSAIKRLQEALDLPENQINRDATIKRFEFTFELSWKLMQAIAQYKGVEGYGPRESIRTGARLDLIDSIESWFELLDARNQTSHVYREDIADDVYAKTKLLPPLVDTLLQHTEKLLNEK
ncbi:nucleotidyltransferase substrate binding protein [Candidatus Gottesmanbacteria bacterium]|nr:nucleotidyltransferase substrate binding protein [Candidatus Gottesmanbacteria bacterium]